MKKIISIILNFIFKHFKIKNNKIVFEAGRDLIDGNPKAVYEYIIDNYPNNYKTIWLVNKGTDVSALRKNDYAYYRTIRGYYHLATAHYWIRSQSLENFIKKKGNQVYIQLWHGVTGLKLMGYDISNEKDRPTIEHAKEWNYFIGNSNDDISHIKSSTGYKKKMLSFRIGMHG